MEERIKSIKRDIFSLIDKISGKNEGYYSGQTVGLEFVLRLIDDAFPELAESEDERVREAIESVIRVYGKTQGEWIAGYDMDTLVVHLREAFGALEKQKEPAPVPNKFSGLKSLMLQYLQAATNRKNDEEIESDTDLWGRKILDYVWKCNERQKEEADRRLEMVEQHCKNVDELGEKIKSLQKKLYGKQKEQHPAEWSEEDEKMLSLARIAIWNDEKLTPRVARKVLRWLKSLRPQPHWKPSEYTLSLVKKVANGEMLTHLEQMAMETLCNDLQKLL